MEVAPKSFIGFLFSRKKISWTLLINFIAGVYFYTLAYDFASFQVGNGWIIGVTAFIAYIWIAFWTTTIKGYREIVHTRKKKQ